MLYIALKMLHDILAVLFFMLLLLGLYLPGIFFLVLLASYIYEHINLYWFICVCCLLLFVFIFYKSIKKLKF